MFTNVVFNLSLVPTRFVYNALNYAIYIVLIPLLYSKLEHYIQRDAGVFHKPESLSSCLSQTRKMGINMIYDMPLFTPNI